MSAKHVYNKTFRSPHLLERLHAIQLTGRAPHSLSFLPDDRQHSGMEVKNLILTWFILFDPALSIVTKPYSLNLIGFSHLIILQSDIPS